MTDEQLLTLWILGRDYGEADVDKVMSDFKSIRPWELNGPYEYNQKFAIAYDKKVSRWFKTPRVSLLEIPLEKHNIDILYVIEDPWCFAPTREQVNLMFAKYWFSKNRERFEPV